MVTGYILQDFSQWLIPPEIPPFSLFQWKSDYVGLILAYLSLVMKKLTHLRIQTLL